MVGTVGNGRDGKRDGDAEGPLSALASWPWCRVASPRCTGSPEGPGPPGGPTRARVRGIDPGRTGRRTICHSGPAEWHRQDGEHRPPGESERRRGRDEPRDVITTLGTIDSRTARQRMGRPERAASHETDARDDGESEEDVGLPLLGQPRQPRTLPIPSRPPPRTGSSGHDGSPGWRCAPERGRGPAMERRRGRPRAGTAANRSADSPSWRPRLQRLPPPCRPRLPISRTTGTMLARDGPEAARRQRRPSTAYAAMVGRSMTSTTVSAMRGRTVGHP